MKRLPAILLFGACVLAGLTLQPSRAHAQACTDSADPWSGFRMDGWLIPFMTSRASDLARNAVRDLAHANPTCSLSLIAIREETFPDASLGCPTDGELYAQVLTPGFVVRVKLGGQVYQVHTSTRDGNVRICEGPHPAVAYQARDELAASTGVPDWTYDIVESEAVNWDNASLGHCLEGDVFATVVTPGYRVTLDQGGVTWEYHTDDTNTVCQMVSPIAGQ